MDSETESAQTTFFRDSESTLTNEIEMEIEPRQRFMTSDSITTAYTNIIDEPLVNEWKEPKRETILTHNDTNNYVKLERNWISFLTGTTAVLIGAIAGFVIGFILSLFDPSKEVQSWIYLPGNLFIRALKLLVVPMVFASLSSNMAGIVAVGKGYTIGWRCAVFCVLTSLLSSIQSVFWAGLLRSKFRVESVQEADTDTVTGFLCSNGKYLQLNENGSLICNADVIGEKNSSSTFILDDLNEFMVKNNAFHKLSLSDQLMGLMKQMVPSNIAEAFAETALLSVIVFSLPFGVAVAKSHSILSGKPNLILDILRNVNRVFLLLIRWATNAAPIAVISLVAGSVLQNKDDWSLLTNVGYFLWAGLLSHFFHMMIVMPALFFFFIRRNPYKYLRQMVPAQVFALGCASSMATLPVTLRCVEGTKEVSHQISRFVLSIGATINMDGASIYTTTAIVFMAEASGLGDKLGAMQMLLLVFVCTIGSIGGAPVPNAGLVMVITIWHTLFSEDLPISFSFVVATDWITDRISTMTNITGDTIITRIIADQVDETYTDEVERRTQKIDDEEEEEEMACI